MLLNHNMSEGKMKLGKREFYLDYQISGSRLQKKIHGPANEQYNVKSTQSVGQESPARFCKWVQECQSLSLDALRSYVATKYQPFTLWSTQEALKGTVLNLKLTPHPDSFCAIHGNGCSDTVVHLLVEPAIDIRI